MAIGTGAAAIGLAAGLRQADLPPALPPLALGLLSMWMLLVVTLLWQRMRWLRPLGLALAALLACCWLPGPDADAVIVVAAVGGVLTAGLAEEYPGLVRRRAVPVGVTTLALLCRAARARRRAHRAAVPEAAAARRAARGRPGRTRSRAGGRPPAPVRPVAISIPALGVAGPLERLAADPVSGELSAPADPSRAGWYAAGVVPGDAGPAVVGGHVDSRAGPGVFFGLRELRPGDRIEITRSDGRAVRFAVTTVAAYPKTRVPDGRRVRPRTRPRAAPGDLRRAVRPGRPQLPGQHRRGRGHWSERVSDAADSHAPHGP